MLCRRLAALLHACEAVRGVDSALLMLQNSSRQTGQAEETVGPACTLLQVPQGALAALALHNLDSSWLC